MFQTKKLVLLIFVLLLIHTIISCSKVHDESLFLLEGNISGLDIDLSLGGFDPSEVESVLVIPLIKNLASNPNIVSVKYQIHPTYFRIFIKASDRVTTADMHDQLISIVNNLPEGFINNELFSSYHVNQFHIFGKLLILPISNMTEQKLTELVPETMGQILIIECDESRMHQFEIQYQDVAEALTGARHQLNDNGSFLLVTNQENIKEVISSKYIVDGNGQQIPLSAFVSGVRYTYAGITRDWTSISQYK